MVPSDTKQSAAELRKFGLVTGAMVAVVFGLALPWLFGLSWPRWPWLVGGILVAWGTLHPRSLQPVYTAWMRFSAILGGFNNRVILGAVFFLLITPFGWLRRRFGGDPMSRQVTTEALSYRRSAKRRTPESFERPF